MRIYQLLFHWEMPPSPSFHGHIKNLPSNWTPLGCFHSFIAHHKIHHSFIFLSPLIPIVFQISSREFSTLFLPVSSHLLSLSLYLLLFIFKLELSFKGISPQWRCLHFICNPKLEMLSMLREGLNHGNGREEGMVRLDEAYLSQSGLTTLSLSGCQDQIWALSVSVSHSLWRGGKALRLGVKGVWVRGFTWTPLKVKKILHIWRYS